MAPQEETKRALIVVRTYPIPSRSGVEVSCTAAITDKGEWLRLFPVPWRLLDSDKQFRKYQWIDVRVTKASDTRPESFKLSPDGIKVITEPLTTAHHWKSRKEAVLPLCAHCLCCLVKQRNANGHPTLGIFRPKSITRLIIKGQDPNWTPNQQNALRQGHLFLEAPEQELEKVPFSFQYEFRCDDDSCKGHTIICTDWEMGEAYRKWRVTYGEDGWEEKFRQRFETEMIQKNETYFYVGTIHGHQHVWIIIGLFYPPHPPDSRQGELF